MSQPITKTSDVIILSSGADHEKVIAQHPEWDEFDWCRYWELDARKAYKKLRLGDFYAPYDPGRSMDCGDPRCKCKELRTK